MNLSLCKSINQKIDTKQILYLADNLNLMKDYLENGKRKVDLIYIDPPFTLTHHLIRKEIIILFSTIVMQMNKHLQIFGQMFLI